MRFLLTIVLVLGALIFLNRALELLPLRLAPAVLVFQYLRFVVAGFFNIFLAPLLFTKLGLAKSTPARAT